MKQFYKKKNEERKSCRHHKYLFTLNQTNEKINTNQEQKNQVELYETTERYEMFHHFVSFDSV